MVIASATQSDRIATLLAWCFDNGIKIDPCLQIRETEDDSIAVFSVDDVIGTPVALVQIPKSTVLSVRSCSLSHHMDAVPDGHGAHLSLAFALLTEILQGENSRWFGYLQSLPQERVDIALFWGQNDWTNGGDMCMNDGVRFSAEDQTSRRHRHLDGTEAQAWLRGTELQKQLRGSDGVTASLLDEVRNYYFTAVIPLLSRIGSKEHQTPTLSCFYRAYSLVSSRAFLVDAYHGLAMVPIADAFNHEQENHVHLESEYDVCNVCGSASECVHDGDEDSDTAVMTAAATGGQGKMLDDDCYYDMVTNAPILAGSEVFNSYGEKLDNAQLLARYGFALDGNEHDCVTWDREELNGLVGDNDAKKRVAELHARLVGEEWGGLADSRLVYDSEAGQGSRREFCVNEDGKITREMWIYCALLGLEGDRVVGTEMERRYESGAEMVKLFREAVDLQVMLEKEGEKSDGIRQTILLPMVMGTIETVLSLCKARKGQLGKRGSEVGRLGEAVDQLPEQMTRTRLAITQVMTEISLLDCCQSGWNELGNVAEVISISHRTRRRGTNENLVGCGIRGSVYQNSCSSSLPSSNSHPDLD